MSHLPPYTKDVGPQPAEYYVGAIVRRRKGDQGLGRVLEVGLADHPETGAPERIYAVQFMTGVFVLREPEIKLLPVKKAEPMDTPILALHTPISFRDPLDNPHTGKVLAYTGQSNYSGAFEHEYTVISDVNGQTYWLRQSQITVGAGGESVPAVPAKPKARKAKPVPAQPGTDPAQTPPAQEAASPVPPAQPLPGHVTYLLRSSGFGTLKLSQGDKTSELTWLGGSDLYGEPGPEYIVRTFFADELSKLSPNKPWTITKEG